MDLNEAAMELERAAMELSLTCPISRGIYNDPVLIQQSGHVVDRKSLCEWLLKNPTRCPVTNVDFGKKLQYCDCNFSKSRLILYGENEYKRYDDSEFQRQYEALQIVPCESKEKKLGARETKSVDHFDQDSYVDPLYYLPKCTGDGPEEAFRLGDGNSYSVDTFTCLDENSASVSDEDLSKIPLDFHSDPFTTLSTEINSPNSSSRPSNVSYQRENIIQKPKVNDSRAIYDTQDKWHVSESMDAKDGGMISSSSSGVAIEEKPSSEPSDNETTASFMEYIESLGNHGNGTNGSVDPFLRFSEDEDDLVDIDQVDITNEDIYCGKENKDSPHPGNIEFRRLIGHYKGEYQNYGSQHGKKTKLRNDIVDRKLFGGRSRFIVKRGNDTFYLQTETKVRTKVSQALREKSNSDKKKQS